MNAFMISICLAFTLILFVKKSMLLSNTTNMTKTKIKNLNDLDQEISKIIRNESVEQVKHMLLYMDTFVKLLRIYFTGIHNGDVEMKNKALSILKKGGPQYFYESASYFAETKFRQKMNLSDVEYQEYLYLRAEAKEKWDMLELKLKNITC